MNIGVIIPARNAATTLGRAIGSAIEAQAEEIIIVYDASEDDTYQIACQYAEKWLGLVNVYHPQSQTPIGVCAARNIGITHTWTELVCPLDADDYFIPDGLDALVDAWQPGTWVYGAYEDDRGEVVIPPPPGMLPKKNIAQATMVFAKEDWLRVGGYDPTFNIGAEDYAFQRRLERAGIHGTRIPQAVYHYTDNPNGRAAVCQRRWPLIQQLLDDECPLP